MSSGGNRRRGIQRRPRNSAANLGSVLESAAAISDQRRLLLDNLEAAEMILADENGDSLIRE